MARGRKIKTAMSRTTRNALIAALFFVLLPFAVILDRQLMRPLRQVIRTEAWASEDRKRYHEHTFDVADVIDGDTLDIAASDGKWDTTRIRLIGVDTPETHHPTVGQMYYGQEAADFTRSIAEGQPITVFLDTVSAERDRYGRLLAYVVLPDGSVMNEKLIREGYGYADLRFRHSLSEDYDRLMDAAMKDKSGIWKRVMREQLPQWLLRERPEILR